MLYLFEGVVERFAAGARREDVHDHVTGPFSEFFGFSNNLKPFSKICTRLVIFEESKLSSYLFKRINRRKIKLFGTFQARR